MPIVSDIYNEFLDQISKHDFLSLDYVIDARCTAD